MSTDENRRININIHSSDISDQEAVDVVGQVIALGRFADEDDSYCRIAVNHQTGFVICAKRTRAGHDTFHLYRQHR